MASLSLKVVWCGRIITHHCRYIKVVEISASAAPPCPMCVLAHNVGIR